MTEVTVIIPAFKRPRELFECLTALSRSTYPLSHFEVIVTDDAFDSGAESIESIRRQTELNLTYLQQNQLGASVARNVAAKQATGDILLFTDHDCAPEPQWISELSQAVRANPGALVGGRTINGLDDIYSRTSQLLSDYLSERQRDHELEFFQTQNIGCRKQDFFEIGMFNEQLPRTGAEDRTLCDAWKHAGKTLVPAPDALIIHRHRMDFKGFCEQHFNYGRSGWLFQKIRRDVRQQQTKIEPLDFYGQMLAKPFQEAVSTAHLVSALLMLSQASYVSGVLYEGLLDTVSRGHGSESSV